jgi:hypothetical protein
MLVALSATIGLFAGLTAALFIFTSEEHPSPSFGLFVFPVVILGLLASTRASAAGVGLVTQMSVVLGHFIGAQFTEYDPGSSEYSGWLVVTLFLGPGLGMLGHLIRSRWKAFRSISTGLTIGLILCPFFFWTQGEAYFTEHMTSFTITFDAVSMLVILILCRGLAVRGTAVAIAVLLSWGFPLLPFLVWMLALSIGGPA